MDWKYSVLKNPLYPHYNKKVAGATYDEKMGYPITYYGPIYKKDMKVPGLKTAEVPFIAIANLRKPRKPFVPRHLTEQDMIQVQLKAEQRARDILKDFHPAQREKFETVQDFRERKEIESKMEEARATFNKIQNIYKKRDIRYELEKEKPLGIHRRASCERSQSRDLVFSSRLSSMERVQESMTKDTNNHLAKLKIAQASVKPETKPIPEETSDDECEEKPKQQRSSSIQRLLDEYGPPKPKRGDSDHSASDAFEKTFSEHMTNLRRDFNLVARRTECFLTDVRLK